jgi:uncharacterized protein (UPF0332 family)
MKTAVKNLVKRAKSALKTAETDCHEQDYNAAVSRAYYAMFYMAEAALHANNLDFTSHRSVISAFGKHFVRTKIFPTALGRQINDAFELRLKGDYAYEQWVSQNEAEEAIAWAKEFVDVVTAYLSEHGHLT